MITRFAVLLPCAVLLWASVDCSSTAASECCPRDRALASCMNLGGSKHDDSSCAVSCDFFCSSRWRVEKDDNGCEVWRYDTRIPPPADALYCFMPDAGHDAADAADAEDALNAPDVAPDANEP